MADFALEELVWTACLLVFDVLLFDHRLKQFVVVIDLNVISSEYYVFLIFAGLTFHENAEFTVSAW